MASLSRSVCPFARTWRNAPSTSSSSITTQCRRSFLTTPPLQSGHNKWSKIKHDKAANDAKKSSVRTLYTRNLTILSRVHGENLDHNPALAALVANAKKAGVPKDRIEAAIALGQGRSTKGLPLTSIVYEALLPPNIALIVEVETESKARVLAELNVMVRDASGSPSASKFYFTRAGRVVFEPGDSGVDVDSIMDDAIEAGAEDLDHDAEGNIVVLTQPSDTTQVGQAVGGKFGLKVRSSEIVWRPNNDTVSRLDYSPELEDFIELLGKLRDYNDVQSIYANVVRGDMTDEQWASIAQNLDM